jgi:transposase-like protein
MRRATRPAVARATAANGASSKTILTDDGEIEIAVPRDRVGSFEPQLVADRRIFLASTARF